MASDTGSPSIWAADDTLSYALLSVLVFISYFVAAKAGLAMAFVHGNVSAVWPPSGIAVAALLLYGWKILPVLTLANFLVTLTTPTPFWISLGIATGNTIEYALAYLLLHLLCPQKDHGQFNSLRTVLCLLPCAIFAPAPAALLGALSLCYGAVAGWNLYWDIVLTWWLGDAVGMLLIAPSCILGFSLLAYLRGLSKEKAIEFFALTLSAVFTAWILFGNLFAFPAGTRSAAYVLFPFIMWGALRFHLFGALNAALAISIPAVIGTAHGVGIFSSDSQTESLLQLQAFIAVLTMTGMIVASALYERQQSARYAIQTERRIRQQNAELQRLAEVSAHHLQEPVRRQISYAQLLAYAIEHMPPHSDINKADLLLPMQFIEQGATRQRALLHDIERFLAAGTALAPAQPQETQQILEQLRQRLHSICQAKQACLEFDHLPPVLIDKNRLEEVFHELISNALQHAHPTSGKLLLITVSARQAGQRVYFRVEDNGQGIAPAYRAKIFAVFETVNPHTTGTGIGLAIVRRIVESVDGHISCHSTPTGGCRFSFDLPAALVPSRH